MKILTLLLFCFVSIASLAQKSPVSPSQETFSSFNLETGNWLDTTNMHDSKYGPVARLTQDNMPCIMPYTSAKPIPNVAKKRTTPDKIPNFWKYKRPQNFPGKQMPIPESLQKLPDFKSPGAWRKEVLKANPSLIWKTKLSFP